MGTCVQCQSETPYHCPHCGAYQCITCRDATKRNNKDRAKTAMCVQVRDYVDVLIENQDVEQADPETYPPDQS